ncbi:methyl-accepting chemotaxis protein [Caproiciproducens galactitolivorans]|uniref:methyl-accepting chemotaxis protein n=1 Tax=Caproiciproducens galactitolivorans TaxID=642589 RepID=UPI003AF3C711
MGINAAIEAARAGTSEKGFGVVAEEIRRLAQRSKDTAHNIEGMTSNIQNSVNRTIDYSNSTLEHAMDQTKFIGKINGSLRKLTDVYLERTSSANMGINI